MRQPASGSLRLDAAHHQGQIVAASMESSLADQTWSVSRRAGPVYRAFFLRRGRAAFASGDGAPIELAAPQILWLPMAASGAFRLFAGGDGASLTAREEIIRRAVNESSLAARLRPLIDRELIAPAVRIGPDIKEIEAIFAALGRESRDPGPGAAAMNALYLGLILAHLWRACGLSGPADSFVAGAPIAERFRQLVEQRYRDNLSVDDYAHDLGVTRAQLHASCVRALGLAPLKLVHARLMAEARLRLQETAQPVEQIGYGLGFRDPSYFNRFFRRLSGLSPGAYRTASRVEATSFAAWP
jgi:AraC family transcriptional regulator, transcriptional activator of pobA